MYKLPVIVVENQIEKNQKEEEEKKSLIINFGSY